MTRIRAVVALLLFVVAVLPGCAFLAFDAYAAHQASMKLLVRVDVEELETAVGIGSRTSRLQHLFENGVASYDNGTGASQADRVWSATDSVAAGTPVAIDLRGPSSVLTGDAIVFAEVVLVCIENNSTVSTEQLTVGAGSNPWITWLGATGDAVVIGAGGFFCISAPVDGFGTTAGTGDILTITASAGDTISYDFLVVGRSA